MNRVRVSLVTLCTVILFGAIGYTSASGDELGKFTEAYQAYASGNYGKAIEGFKSCAGDEGDTSHMACGCRVMLGKLYVATGQYAAAISHLQRTITCEDKRLCADSYLWLGRAHYYNKQYPEGLNAFKQAISLNPSESDNFNGLSASYNALEQYDEAITAAKRSIELKPDNAKAYNNLGEAYGHRNRDTDALTAFRKASEIEPQSAAPYKNIGNLFLQREDYGRAADNYKKAAELTPGDTSSLFNLAITYMAMGRYDDAIAIADRGLKDWASTGTGLEQALSMENGYPVVKAGATAAKAQVFGSGPARKADIQVGDKIIKIDGQSTKGENIAKLIQRLSGHAGTQVTLAIERNGVKEPLTKVVTQETYILKGGAPFLALRGRARREKGRAEESYHDAEQAYALDPKDMGAQRAMALAYIDRGKYAEALNILSTIEDSPLDRILEAVAQAKLGNMGKAVEIYSAIPGDYFAGKNASVQSYRRTLLDALKPYANDRKNAARAFETKQQYREALKEYAELVKVADDAEAKETRKHVAALAKDKPYLAEVPEEARKYAVRAEVLLKEGQFDESLNEFNSALKIAPFAPQLYFNTAIVHGELKHYRSATLYMNMYVDLSPNASNIRQVKDEMYKWELMTEKEKGGK